MSDPALGKVDRGRHRFVRPAWPYTNDETILSPFGKAVSQKDYDALVIERDRLLRLCQAHGLMANG